MTVLHLVANRVLPYPGGLQESVLRIGGNLARSGCRVIVYTLRQPPDHQFAHVAHQGQKVVHLTGLETLLEPYQEPQYADLHATESSRITSLLLQNAIESERLQSPSARHLIVSFYASGTGFIAQMTASALGMPHLAAVRGTDFELDVFGARQHPRLRATIEGADQVVTTNRQQAHSLTAAFRIRRRVRTIHNALAQPGERPIWRPPPVQRVQLVADCGFSGRKATHLLMAAVANLVERGVPVSLTVLGGIFWVESQAYWEQKQEFYASRYPGRFTFPGQVTADELEGYLLASHAYCSASLAEGCSMSHIRALTLGIPIVATATGALPEIADNCRHVRLCRAGDPAVLSETLEEMVTAIIDGTVSPDLQAVARWRQHFCPEREREEWASAVESALDAGAAPL